ncbi:MAG: hypothetical protein WD894_15900 [Pirellulales bacterium]
MLLIAAVIVAPGCSGPGAPPPANQQHIEIVAGWYEYYRTKNGNKPPPNEGAFVAYIERELKDRGQTVDTQELLTSPRDSQKYVVRYGAPNSTSRERNVAVYEREGYDGKKWLAFENKWSEEVDEAKLQEYLARK